MKRISVLFIAASLLLAGCSNKKDIVVEQEESAQKTTIDEIREDVDKTNTENSSESESNMLQQIETFSNFLNDYKNGLSEPECYTYLMYDINRDGNQELLIEKYTYHAEETGYLYTYKDNEVQYLGEVETYSNSEVVGYEDSLLIFHIVQGDFWTTQVKLVDDKISDERIYNADANFEETGEEPFYGDLGIDTEKFINLEFESLDSKYNIYRSFAKETFVLKNMTYQLSENGVIEVTGSVYKSKYFSDDYWNEYEGHYRNCVNMEYDTSVAIEDDVLLSSFQTGEEEYFQSDSSESLAYSYFSTGNRAELCMDDNGKVLCVRVWPNIEGEE